jgi:hypothetical protein
MATRHVVLLGDSVFDNAAYVRGGPDVVAQRRWTERWWATWRGSSGAPRTTPACWW